MKSAFAPVAAAALLASGVAAQLMVNTPSNVVVCQPTLLSWSGGTPPYFLTMLPGGQPNAPPVLDFGQLSSTSMTWIANFTAGTSLGLDLKDSTGTLVQSAAFTINPGSGTSCLAGSTSGSSSSSSGGSSSSGSSSSGSTSTPAQSPSPPANTPTNTPTNSPSTPANTPSTSPSGASSTGSGQPSSTSPAAAGTTSSAAQSNVANAAFAGVMAAFLALLV